jgi:hypothetical protein
MRDRVRGRIMEGIIYVHMEIFTMTPPPYNYHILIKNFKKKFTGCQANVNKKWDIPGLILAKFMF